MTTALVLIAIIVAVGIGWAIVENDPYPIVAAGLLVAVVCVVWLFIASPYSNRERDICQEKATGYGLERSDWSMRHNCRVYLPGGELVPESRIRITVDGQIIVTDDDA